MLKKEECWLFPTVINLYSLLDTVSTTEVCLQIDKEAPANNSLITNGIRSSASNFLNSLPAVKTAMQKCVDNYTEQLGLFPCEISYSWCNIYSRNGFIKPHRHELSLVSGVFYAGVDNNSGELVFDNPCQPFKVNEISTKITEYNRQHFKFNVVAGDLILFPSWIMHYSENNFSDKRYVVSFDTGLKK